MPEVFVRRGGVRITVREMEPEPKPKRKLRPRPTRANQHKPVSKPVPPPAKEEEWVERPLPPKLLDRSRKPLLPNLCECDRLTAIVNDEEIGAYCVTCGKPITLRRVLS